MFIGHFAMGLAAKRVAPQLPLAATSLAAQWADLLWPLFVALGWEHVRLDPDNTAFTPLDFQSYPYSHSLLMLALWGALLAGGWWLLRRDARGAFWLGALVLSHWLLDWISHRPDMPLAPGLETRTGLSLWNSPAATILVEGLMFAVGLRFFLSAAPPSSGRARWTFWSMIAFLAVMYVAVILGPPPPSAEAAAYAGIGLGLAWAYAAERQTRG